MRRSFSTLFGLPVCGLVLMSCPDTNEDQAFVGGQSGDEGGNDAQSISVPGGPTPVPYCSRSESDGPDGPSRYYSCHHEQPDINWNPNKPTPPGTYDCDCDGTRVEAENAADCEGAMDRSCKVDLNAPLPCSSGNVDSICWPVPGEPEQWKCQCGGSGELLAIAGSDCQEVAFLACARSCSNILGQSQQLGQCQPQSDAIGYDCTCNDGLSASWAGTTDCNRALVRSCLPACETSRGHCAQRSNGFDCVCEAGAADASQSVSESIFTSNDEAYGNCPLALEISCGFPVAGETCEEIEDLGVRLSCEADGDGDWNCDCPILAGCSDNTNYTSGDIPAEAASLPGMRPIAAPPAGLLDQPRTCRAAIETYCWCP